MALISKRGENIGFASKECRRLEILAKNNKYDKRINPLGTIDVGSASNRICEDIVLEKLRSYDVQLEAKHLHYPTSHGSLSLREATATFIKKFFRPKIPFSADNIVAVTGLNTGLEQIIFSLTERGECVLAPTPFWDKIPQIVSDRCGVLLEEVPLSAKDGYMLTVNKLEEGLARAKTQGRNVAALFLINPNNPLGLRYTQKQLADILQFAKRHSIHVILDEIYALSSHGTQSGNHGYQGVLTLDELPDPERTHIAWAVSKDLSLSGFRVGFLISSNNAVLQALSKLCFYGMVPSHVQEQMCWLLQQNDWYENTYFPVMQSRLHDVVRLCTGRLEKIGVGVLKPDGGLYLWLDMTNFLSERTFEAEGALAEKFINAGVYLRPGKWFRCDTPGYFRIIIAHDIKLLTLVLDRIESMLRSVDVQKSSEAAGVSLADLDIDDDFQIVEMGTKKGESENLEDLVKSLKKQIKDSDWLNPDTPHREAQERVWTVLDPSAENPSGENPAEQSPANAEAEGTSDSLADMMRTFKQNIRSSDWLKDQDGRWEAENPEAAKEYRKAMTGKVDDVECKTQ